MANQIVLEKLEDLQTVFDGIASDWNDARFMPVLEIITGMFETSHFSYFADRKSPGGEPWAALAPRTVQAKGHSRQLYLTGRLMESLANTTSDSYRDAWDETKNHGVSFGTQVEYAIFHQDGTEHIPQREHVGTNETQLEAILDLVADESVRILREHYDGGQ